MLLEIPPSVLPLFVAAGWTPERRVPLPEEVDPLALRDHPALHVLERLSGLRVGTCGPGVECAKSDLEFGILNCSDVSEWEASLGTRLVKVGQVHRGHGALYVGSDGVCYSLSFADGRFYLAGESFGIAVDRMLRGLTFRTILHPE